MELLIVRLHGLVPATPLNKQTNAVYNQICWLQKIICSQIVICRTDSHIFDAALKMVSGGTKFIFTGRTLALKNYVMWAALSFRIF